ncbi:alpha/beta hydrolase [Inquilinus sp. OTU3971]|uniref:alpha/beta hydrolase n=1 Tax=Inquilinus sp. OTU3971 TaxID=3043855 RepID=UPI00313D862C
MTRREALPPSRLVEAIASSRNWDGTAAIFVHGYNYSYQEALYRAAQMAADAQPLGTPAVFSWPSAASVAGYVADRDAVLYSRTELARLVQTLSASPRVKRVVLFGHSLGGFLTMEAVRQLKMEGRADTLAKLQVVLAAPDIDIDVFRSQLLDIGPMKTPITLLVSKGDKALALSNLLGGERGRVGSIDIDDPVVQEAARAERLRVIDISSLKSADGLGHDRYAALAKFGGELARAENAHGASPGNVGAFVFDAAGAAVASPFKLAGALSRQ